MLIFYEQAISCGKERAERAFYRVDFLYRIRLDNARKIIYNLIKSHF